jgi:Tfp pilus assembly protein PilO
MPNKIDVTLYLKYLIFPIISIISMVFMYVLVISPYLSLKSDFENSMASEEALYSKLENKVVVLKKARSDSANLKKYQDKLVQLVPNEETPAVLVGLLDSTSSETGFTRIDENKNVVDQNNEKKGLIEVKFNGRTVGPLSAKNFVEKLNNSKNKIINLKGIELYDDSENRYLRVSFTATTIFTKTKVSVIPEEPVIDIFNDNKFIENMSLYLD